MFAYLSKAVRALKKLLVLMLGVCALAFLLALGACAVFLGAVATAPSRADRIEAERVEFYYAHAEDWGQFCQEYVCEEIPEGFTVKSMGGQTYTLPRWSTPYIEGECRLTTDSRDHTQYIDRVFQRGASLDTNGMSFYVHCEKRPSRAQYWEDKLLIYGGEFWLREPSWNYSYKDKLGPGGVLSSRPKPTHASRLSMLQPATSDFMLFNDEGTTSSRVYLSTEPLFQGRYVALICNDRCEMKTVVFEEDRHLTSLHVDELLQFQRYGFGCKLFEAAWSCGPPWNEQLASIARYIRFLDSELDKARSAPLSIRNDKR